MYALENFKQSSAKLLVWPFNWTGDKKNPIYNVVLFDVGLYIFI